MDFEFHSQTDTGRIRQNNEDSVAIDPEGRVVVLADGMGGYNAGEVASQMACEFVCSELVRWLAHASGAASDADVRRAMDICVDNANRAIFEASHSNPGFSGMGTTLVVGVFRPGRVLIGHVGDSRAYLWRDPVLTQATRDHSLLQEQIDAGILTESEAAVSVHRNLVTRAVGVEESVMLETRVHELLPGDVLLMCSDGLSDMLDDAQVAAILSQPSSLADWAESLVLAANAAGGRDNIAVTLTRAVGAAAEAGSPRSWWPFCR